MFSLAKGLGCVGEKNLGPFALEANLEAEHQAHQYMNGIDPSRKLQEIDTMMEREEDEELVLSNDEADAASLAVAAHQRVLQVGSPPTRAHSEDEAKLGRGG